MGRIDFLRDATEVTLYYDATAHVARPVRQQRATQAVGARQAQGAQPER